MRSGNPHVSRSGLDTGSAHASSSSPSEVSEFGRMRIEIEILKNALSEEKKNNTKQAKKIEDLEAEIVIGKAKIVVLNAKILTMDEREVQLRHLYESEHTSNEELMNEFETLLTCNICMEVFNNPFSLSPCGHTFCLRDLQEWFRKAPSMEYAMDDDIYDPEYIMNCQKSCPTCRAIVIGRPLPVYSVKDIINALQKAKPNGGSAADHSTISSCSKDPWEGLFPLTVSSSWSSSPNTSEDPWEGPLPDDLFPNYDEVEGESESGFADEETDGNPAGLAYEEGYGSAMDEEECNSLAYHEDTHGIPSDEEKEEWYNHFKEMYGIPSDEEKEEWYNHFEEMYGNLVDEEEDDCIGDEEEYESPADGDDNSPAEGGYDSPADGGYDSPADNGGYDSPADGGYAEEQEDDMFW
ncbi:ring finger domain protein [Lentinula edodes]|uniref:Ring finger domain protein n=1 Tax=Lentinula edodes TaxID=5353 RepID=A0A1Q3DW78_LENED|nr:ring finger domain protein [Lentinula edodes]